jgi:hypothetical protein
MLLYTTSELLELTLEPIIKCSKLCLNIYWMVLSLSKKVVLGAIRNPRFPQLEKLY